MTCLVIIEKGVGIFTCEQTKENMPFSKEVSYVTDVPIDVLNAIIKACDDDSDFEVEFDTEGGGRWFIEASNDKVVAVIEDSDSEVKEVCELRITKQQLMHHLLMDIYVDIKGWLGFLSVNATDTEIAMLDNKLRLLLDKARTVYKVRYSEWS